MLSAAPAAWAYAFGLTALQPDECGAIKRGADLVTAPLLLVYIRAAILLQVAGGVGIANWRLRRGVAAESGATEVGPLDAPGAWQGWREFRVVRREFEDSGQAQWSFYLEPVDGLPVLPFKAGQLRLSRAHAGECDPQARHGTHPEFRELRTVPSQCPRQAPRGSRARPRTRLTSVVILPAQPDERPS